MFHPSVVGVCQLIRHQFMICIFTKQSVQWWCWYIADTIFVIFVDVEHKYIIFIASNFLLFARDLFNLIACRLFNCFTHILLSTIISLIFTVRIYLTIFIINNMFSYIITLSLSKVILNLMLAASSTSAVHFFESVDILFDHLATIRQYLMSSYSYFYFFTISSLLLMDIAVAVQTRSHIEWQKFLPH